MTTLVALMGLNGALIALAVLAVALIANHQRPSGFVYGASFALTIAGFVLASAFLVSRAAPETVVLPIGLPWLGAHFRLDALSSFFIAVIELGAAAASFYALGYGRHEQAPERVLPFYPAFLAGMGLVPLADDAFAFLFVWEFMSLTSWALVMAHHQNPENSRAGYVYVLMANFGTVMLLLAFGLLAGANGSYQFSAMRLASPSPGVATAAFLIALVGAGSKAGLAPLHVWLPLAHPAAPSHVSALMSGVMTKVAVYAFVRIAFDLVGPLQWWWSIPVLVVAAATALLGVLYALMQHDLKRLLAYHTVENIGIIFIGIGLALAFKVFDMPTFAALALTAGLLHVFNHSLFKSLLFFGAGAVLTATGERDMERLGGLFRGMPKTGLAFLVGCVAISALPPFNGFVSEWLTFQAILLTPALPSWGLKLLSPAVGAILALAAALAAACFVKTFGVAFLGRPRSPQAEQAKETDPFSLAAMFSLAILCLLVGLLPGLVIDALRPVVQAAVGDTMPMQSQIGRGCRSRRSRRAAAPTTACSSRCSSSFRARSRRRRFTASLRRRCAARPPGIAAFPTPARRPNTPPRALASRSGGCLAASCFPHAKRWRCRLPATCGAAKFHAALKDPIWDSIYLPIARSVETLATRLNPLQFLTIRQYLSIVFGALVALLLVLAGAP